MDKFVKEVDKMCATAVEEIPCMQAGDFVHVHAKVVEKNKERVQEFRGNVIQVRGDGGQIRNVTVRMLSSGVYVERIFPIPSPNVVKIEVKRKAKTGRKRRFYLRDVKGEIKTKVKYKIG